MAHTYISELVHCVFSTKNRANTIRPERQTDLWSYLRGIARTNGFKAVAIGGTANHVHVLLSLPATMPVAKAVQLLKGGSSKWLNDTDPGQFGWQDGYGAFSVGISQQADTVAYINSQSEHHARKSFEEEFLAFLKKHGIDYDPKFVWG
jgi:REP element-mobilizing transposase RayT